MPQPARTPLLRVRKLTRRYGDHTVVSDLDLDVNTGTAVALVGRGSGKSTVLRCVVGADVLTGGSVELAGSPVDERSPRTRP